MNKVSAQQVIDSVRNEAREVVSSIRDAAGDIRRVSAGPASDHVPWIDPIRMKRLLLALLKVLIIIELVSAFLEGAGAGRWSRFGVDLVIAGLLYVLWERIMGHVREKKRDIREKMMAAPQDIKAGDALIFSLLWSDEIYTDIPADRRRIVVISYTLIAVGLVAAFVRIGTGLMPLIIPGLLVLAAVNLVIWVVSLERGEKESLKTELRLARDLQMSLIPPETPAVEGFEVAGLCVPAKDVGGDLFDYVRLGSEDGVFGVSVFDVSGKGMQAAMSALFTSGAFATEARRTSSPAEILTRLNRAVYSHSRRGHFVAFLLAAFYPGSRTLLFANAGQTRPLLLSGDRVEWLEPTGVHFPLGMREASIYEERTVRLSAGDTVFLFTDGYTDAMNGRKELFGTDRIETVVRSQPPDRCSAREYLDAISAEVRVHMGSVPQHDDMTMVVVRVV